MKLSANVTVIGSTMIDLVAYTQRIPAAGETLVGDSFQMGFGGKGANQAVMARLLGARVSIATCLGDDAYGDMTMSNFASFGIDTTHVSRTTGSSGVAPIWVEPDGTNRIIIVPGANDAMSAENARRAVASTDPSVVLGQLEIPQTVTTAGFEHAHRSGVTTVLNPAPAAKVSSDLLGVTDWLIPNEVEFRSITGSDATDEGALREFATSTGTRLVVTMGDQGAVLVTSTGAIDRTPATPVAATDTTGAGDAFVGAFASALAAGMSEQDAVRIGVACASDSVTRPGTQSSFPGPDRAEELVIETTGD